MISCEMEKLHPSARKLVKDRVASRIHKKDATLYGFSEEAQECARNFMGWVDCATKPPIPVKQIQEFADDVVASGIETVILIGQGGSTQAPMTITKYNKIDSNRVSFRTIDSDSPVRVRELLALGDAATTLVVLSSKSGTTLEPRTMFTVLRTLLVDELGEEEALQHLVAVTDPGSELDTMAREEGWRAVWNGEPAIGGRFSALSIFGLLPAALAGIDLASFIKHARAAEKLCSQDAIDNPAIGLAAFLYDNYRKGRDKFCFLTPKRGRVLGLWIEQLVAESLGKHGKGILPNIEIDSLLLKKDPGDRTVIMYQTQNDLWDEQKNFEMSLAYVDPKIPSLHYRIDSVDEVAEHFVMWEYAIAMCGYLMKVCPFDQPDVASAKAKVSEILDAGVPEPDFIEETMNGLTIGEVEVRLSPFLEGCTTLEESLRSLLGSIQPGDYFALNAFLPFTGEFRREALEQIRHGVADAHGVVSCLEVGPRYLHSTGQLQKGGKNNGVFLLLSATELKDIPVESKADSLGELAKAQAIGDFMALAERDRRCLHVHLPDNSGATLRVLAQLICRIASEQHE